MRLKKRWLKNDRTQIKHLTNGTGAGKTGANTGSLTGAGTGALVGPLVGTGVGDFVFL